MAKEKQVIGAKEVKAVSESIPIEGLPSNKTIYVARLNNNDDPDVDPKRCKNTGEVFDTFKPAVETTVESLEGETVTAKFEFKKIDDFSPQSIIEQNEELSDQALEKELMSDMVKQIDKNISLRKSLKDPKKREEFLRLIDNYISLLGS